MNTELVLAVVGGAIVGAIVMDFLWAWRLGLAQLVFRSVKSKVKRALSRKED